jgi:uncharacterized protein (TIGR02246 family)
VRRTIRILIVGAFGAALVAGGGISAAAITLPSSVPATATPSAPYTPSAPPTTPSTPTPTTTPSAPPTTGTPKPPTEQQIKDLFKGWDEALATGDATKVADRYAPDAVLLPTVSDEVRKTRAGIIDYFEHFLAKKPRGTIKDSTVKIIGDKVAIDTGVYEFTVTTDGVTEKVPARYTFVYELRDGKWLIVNHHSSKMPEKK